jgi:nitrite reductase/ring-hydroxylating ferredoxin subunit
MSDMKRYSLCTVDELEEPGSKGFELSLGDGVLSLFVVRRDNRLHAYLNSCPHTGAPLEWVPDQFLDLDKSFIECATHGALFTIEEGRCVSGPCAGQSLQALEIAVDDGVVYLVTG